MRDQMRRCVFGARASAEPPWSRPSGAGRELGDVLALILLGTDAEIKRHAPFLNTRYDERKVVKKLPRGCDRCGRQPLNLHVAPCCLAFSYCHREDCILSCRRFWDVPGADWAEIDDFQRTFSANCVAVRAKIARVLPKIDFSESGPATQKNISLFQDFDRNRNKYLHKACEYIASTKKERKALMEMFT